MDNLNYKDNHLFDERDNHQIEGAGIITDKIDRGDEAADTEAKLRRFEQLKSLITIEGPGHFNLDDWNEYCYLRTEFEPVVPNNDFKES